ncbi:MAG: hypothetical protein R6U25_13165, partial [Alkalispirochaeta sp.]
MKRNFGPVRALTVLGVIAVLSACTAPYAPPGGLSDVLGDRGGLRFSRLDGTLSSGESVFSAQTALPQMSYDEIAVLRILLQDGPDGSDPRDVTIQDPEIDSSGLLATPIEIEDLIPGEWTLIVEAWNAQPDSDGAGVILRGSSDITIDAGTFADANGVVVEPVDTGDSGAWEFTVTWPEESTATYPLTDVVDEIAYRVDDGAWQTVAAVDSAADGVYEQTIGEVDVAPGTYQIAVELRATTKAAPYDVVARYDSIYRVYSNITTRLTENLTSDDFAYGGGARLEISIELPQDLEGFFADAPESSVIAGEPYTIDAGTLGDSTVDSYTWRVDFAEVASGPDETTLEITPDPDQAGQVLLIVLVVEVDGSLYSGEHRVRI